MVGRSVRQQDVGQDWFFHFGPKWGVYMPVNPGYRETYGGSAFLYGMGLTGFYHDLGVRLEVEHVDGDRLLPLNETNKWKNVQTNLSLTPFWASVMKRFSEEPWMVHVGAGLGVVIANERYRGEAYTDNNNPTVGTTGFAYRYTDFSQTDTLFGMQLLLGFTRNRRFGFELKYSYVPRRGSAGFADLGGLSTLLTLSF